MANRIEFAVTMTPIVTGTPSEGMSTDTLAGDVRKTLGGSGKVESGQTSPSVTVDYTTTAGYSTGTVAYHNANNAVVGTGTNINPGTNPDFVYFKHTGCAYSNATTLGALTTIPVTIYIYNVANATYLPLCILRPGEAIVLPMGGVSLADFLYQLVLSSAGSVAIEYFITT